MKLSFISTVIKGGFIFLAIFVLNSCGEGMGGGGGGGGAKESGLYINVDSIAPKNIQEEATSDIDMTWNTDCSGDGSTTTTDVEPFGSHTASVTLSAARVPGATDSPAAGSWIQINRYTVEYTVNQGSSGPSFLNKEYSESVKISAGGTATTTAQLMPKDFKTPYISTWNLGYPVYTVTYTFYGEDDRGRDVWARGFLTVTMGGFNNCS